MSARGLPSSPRGAPFVRDLMTRHYFVTGKERPGPVRRQDPGPCKRCGKRWEHMVHIDPNPTARTA